MSTDFKSLWNREESKVPDINEIFMKANQLKRKIRRKLWRENILMGATIIFISWIWWHEKPELITTKIGIVLIIIAIISFVVANNRQLPLLNVGDVETDSKQYLAQMIRLKQKQEFIGSTMTMLYFITLSTGLALYMFEYAKRGSVLVQVTYYGITFAWMAVCWFYFAPRGVKKQSRAINEVISRLEAVNGQLDGE